MGQLDVVNLCLFTNTYALLGLHSLPVSGWLGGPYGYPWWKWIPQACEGGEPGVSTSAEGNGCHRLVLKGRKKKEKKNTARVYRHLWLGIVVA
jgi:hypothetical protein